MTLVRLSVLIFLPAFLYAQNTTTVLFPGQTGTVLLNNIVAQYKPAVVLPYNMARDTLYAKILAKNDSLSCIYTGHTLYLDPAADPTQYVYLDGAPNGINAEHAYPQSKGAGEGNARSDMHNLYPARAAVNAARVNQPLGESPDNSTLRWYILNQVTSIAPAVNRDGYTEDNDIVFEPREMVKGDLARSIFYFFTMYNAQAIAADPAFFEIQRATLCQWHVQDPVSQEEFDRSAKIAPYQENKPNPFVLDCTLPYRTGYCPNDPVTTCAFVSDVNTPEQTTLALTAAPMPCTDYTVLSLDAPFAGEMRVELLAVTGKVLQQFVPMEIPAGSQQHRLPFENPVSGTAFLHITLQEYSGKSISKTIPLIFIP